VATKEIIERIYTKDAYHSLSIEGYQVTEDLIKKIAESKWNPETEDGDRQQLDAMAAKGYLASFKDVLNSINSVRNGEDPGAIFENDLQKWYRSLFSPSVQAGISAAADLSGYRNGQVYIKGSRHIPPPKDAVPDAMNSLVNMLAEEPAPAVRAVLGHFMLGFIHPYMDGNGRIARFLMNLMLVTGGYNWTVVRVERRLDYMNGLELCSSKQDISLFTDVIASEMVYWREHAPRT
jgi:Fic family protein